MFFAVNLTRKAARPVMAVAMLVLAVSAVAVGDTTRDPLDKNVAIYNPKADALADIQAAVNLARDQNKNVLVMVGGNWCIWCRRLEKLMVSDKKIEETLKKGYIRVHVNYSEENKNEKALASLGYPQRFGYPVLVILDADGKRLHTQNTGLLEQGKAHDPGKVLDMLARWSPQS